MEEEARGANLDLRVSAFAMLSIEIFTTGMLKCRNAKWRNKCKTLSIQSNGAGEFEHDQRDTVALHNQSISYDSVRKNNS
jgi:hypothetical protein